jgi:hypothetical protein
LFSGLYPARLFNPSVEGLSPKSKPCIVGLDWVACCDPVDVEKAKAGAGEGEAELAVFGKVNAGFLELCTGLGL